MSQEQTIPIADDLRGSRAARSRTRVPPRTIIGFTILLAATAPGRTAGLDFGVAAGVGPASGNARADPSGKGARPAAGWTLLFHGAADFLHRKHVVLGLEIPLAVHGARSADISAQRSYAGVYTERLTAVLTPGVRVRLLPARRRVSPWLAFGAGIAVVHRTGQDFQSGQPFAAQVGSSRTPALSPVAGADIPVARRCFLRLEARDYLYRTPATGFVTSFAYWNRWNHNLVLAGGVGFRFD